MKEHSQKTLEPAEPTVSPALTVKDLDSLQSVVLRISPAAEAEASMQQYLVADPVAAPKAKAPQAVAAATNHATSPQAKFSSTAAVATSHTAPVQAKVVPAVATTGHATPPKVKSADAVVKKPAVKADVDVLEDRTLAEASDMVATLDKEMVGESDDTDADSFDKEIAGYNNAADARLEALDKEEAGADPYALAGEASVAITPTTKHQATVELAPPAKQQISPVAPERQAKLAAAPAAKAKAHTKEPAPNKLDAFVSDLHNYLAEPENELEQQKVHPNKKRITLSKSTSSTGIAKTSSANTIDQDYAVKLKATKFTPSKNLVEYLLHGAKAAAFDQNF